MRKQLKLRDNRKQTLKQKTNVWGSEREVKPKRKREKSTKERRNRRKQEEQNKEKKRRKATTDKTEKRKEGVLLPLLRNEAVCCTDLPAVPFAQPAVSAREPSGCEYDRQERQGQCSEGSKRSKG